MAAVSLLALLDDIAVVLDDVAILTKITAKKAAGVLGDDLALNAEQVTGVRAERELPVVWAVAKGSMLNKAILVPAALAISAFIPWLIVPLLMLGGLFLCYEGFEKVAHKFFHSDKEDAEHHEALITAVAAGEQDLMAFENDKIKGAIRTDFILSAEIIVIALGIVAGKPLITQVGVLTTIAILMTIGVYGLVAAIVKLDDVGQHLVESGAGLRQRIGHAILWFAPWFMKALTIAGTAAMFLVGGGILAHGIPAIEHWIHGFSGLMGDGFAWLLTAVGQGVLGIIAGGLAVLIISSISKLFGGSKEKAAH